MSLRDLLKLRRSLRKQKNVPLRDVVSDQDLNELWTQCPSCKAMLYNDDLRAKGRVCNKCDHHFRMSAYERLEFLADPGTWEEINSSLSPSDPLNFVDLRPYRDSIELAKKKSGSTEAVITGTCTLNGEPVALGIMDFTFMGGSMGSVVGERIYRLAETSVAKELPLVLICSSGGARMHEGLFSLMQMAKTTAAVNEVMCAGLVYISVLVDPTYGGVTASFATLGDIIIAEPKAKIGFAGPRVIEETIRQKLPKDFQTSEYLLAHGQLDMVVHRYQLKATLANLTKLHRQGGRGLCKA